MPVSKYAFSKVKRQEQFSIAYVRSLASVAGFKIGSVNEVDEDSVDFHITQKGDSERSLYPKFTDIKVQLKCTYGEKPRGDGKLHYPLKAKNYDDLRQETGLPFILVVLCIPTGEESDWLIEGDSFMALHNVAYWVSLRGQPPLPESATEYKNRTTTIHIPCTNRFNVSGLIAIMDTIADGRFPS